MLFSQIHPFIRLVHKIKIDDKYYNKPWVPYDNRCFFVSEGSVLLTIDDITYSFDEGYAVFIPSGIKYQILRGSVDSTLIGVNFDYTRDNFDKQSPIVPVEVERYSPSFKLESVSFDDAATFNKLVHIKVPRNIIKAFFKLCEEFEKKMLYFNEYCSNIFSEILFECSRILGNQSVLKGNHNVEKIIEFINQNYARTLTYKMISDEFFLHPNYISALIKKHTGMPFHKYLMHIRITNSIEYLESGKFTISEVAEKCGFGSVYHYSKAFAKNIGIPPSSY